MFEKNARRVDKNRRKIELNVGDLVYLRLSSKLNRGKLDEIRAGPFKIKEMMSDSVYEIDARRKKRENNIYHKNDLIPL